MSHEIDDIMINTQLYGIHSPINYHSFQNTWKIVFLQYCQGCNSRILPFTPACECLRCGCVAHRKCIGTLPNCSFFTFEKPANRNDGNFEIDSPKRARLKSKTKSMTESLPPTDKTANDMHFDSIFELRLEEIIEKACSIPAILGYIPQIKSPFCIWRTLLRAVVVRQTTDLDRGGPICSTEDSSTAIESKIRLSLKDIDGFAGQLFVCCFYVFMSLNVLDTQELVVMHGRECIDTIVDGVLCVCNDDITHDSRVVRGIILAVEKFIFHEQNGAFYEKIFQFMVRDSTAKKFNKHFRECHVWSANHWKEFDKYASAICRKHSPKEKLVIFVVFLQLITEVTAGTSSNVDNSAPDVSQLYIAPSYNDDEPKIEKSDDLHVIDSSYIQDENGKNPLRREDINADKLLELLGCIIQRQQEEGICNWIAEYLFLSSDLVSNDSVDAMAAEGYALATLQQCISILLQPE